MIKDQDKDVLINSMKNLVKHILQGPTQQTDIFQSLSQNDFSKIIDNLNDNNKSLRKVSSLFLCEVLYDNIQNQVAYCENNELPAIPGFISLNQIPTCFNMNEKVQKALFQTLKQEQAKYQDQTICWYVNVSDINEKALQVKIRFFRRGTVFNLLFIIYQYSNWTNFLTQQTLFLVLYYRKRVQIIIINLRRDRRKVLLLLQYLKKIVSIILNQIQTLLVTKWLINRMIWLKQYHLLTLFKDPLLTQNRQLFQQQETNEKSINSTKTNQKPIQQIFKVNNFVSQNQEHSRVRSPNAYNVRNQNTKYSIDIKMS